MDIITVAVAKAREGSIFRTREWAPCPLCGAKGKVVGSPKWNGKRKIRYHKCCNPACAICRMGIGFKSVQEERPDA